jgi:hypothetical protein
LDGTIGVGITGTVMDGMATVGEIMAFLTMETITTIVLIHTTKQKGSSSSYSNTVKKLQFKKLFKNRTSTIETQIL